MNAIRNLLKDYKTTLAGVAAICFAIGTALNAISNNQPIPIETVTTGLVTGIGLILAKDSGGR